MATFRVPGVAAKISSSPQLGTWTMTLSRIVLLKIFTMSLSGNWFIGACYEQIMT